MGKGCNGRFSTRGCSRHQRTLPTGSHSEGAEKLLLVKRKLGFLPFSSVQLLSPVRFFATLCTAASQATLSITNSPSLLKLMFIESVMPSSHLILCHPFLLLPSIFQPFNPSTPASGSFPMSQFLASGGQSIGASASASVLLMDIQD